MVQITSSQETSQGDTSQSAAISPYTDSVLQLSLKLFTSSQRIDPEERDNLIIQDFGGYLRRYRNLDITSSSSLSQTNNLSLFGVPSANIGLYSGEFFFNPSSLTIPFQARAELNYVPFENLKSVWLVENPLLNLFFADSKLGGVYLEEKDYTGGEPYSRLTFEQRMRGYRRTQVELGRGFRSKLRFYGTLGIHKSDGELLNTDQDLNNYSFRLSYDFNQKTRFVASSQFHSGQKGLLPFPGWEIYNLRRKESYQKLNFTLYRRLSEDRVLKAGFDFAQAKQELRPVNWENIERIYGIRLDLYPPNLGRNSTRLSWNSYRYDYQDQSSRFLQKDNFSVTNLLQVSPRLWWLAWGNFEGIDSTGDFFIDRKVSFLTGLAFQPGSDWRMYASGGRINTYPSLKEVHSPARSFPVNDTLPIYAEKGNLTLRSGYHWYSQSGIDWEKRNLKLGSYFYLSNATREVIVTRIDTLTSGYWTPLNSDFQVRGLNSYLQLVWSGFGTLYANWNYKTWNKGDQPAYLPKNSAYGYLELDRQFLRKQLSLEARLETEYLGRRRGEVNKLLDHVAILNSKFSFRILDANFYFVIENLTNQTYRSGSQFRMPKRTNWWGLYWEFFD